MTRKRNIAENLEPADADQWEDWVEYLDYFEYDLDIEELKKLIVKFGLDVEHYFEKRVAKLSDGKQSAYLFNDKGDLTYIKDIEQWVWDFNDWNADKLGIDPEDIYNGWVESSLKDLKQNPGTVFHWTTEEKWELIQKAGGMHQSWGTGINNRSAHGIFTSVNPEEYALGSYGDTCLEIDLEAFKKSMGFRELNLEFEPEAMEYLLRDYIRSVLGMESRDDMGNDGGISPYTVIVNHNMPLQFIKVR